MADSRPNLGRYASFNAWFRSSWSQFLDSFERERGGRSRRRGIGRCAAFADGHLHTLAVMLGVNNLAGQLGQATLVLFATRTLGLNPQLFGLLFVGAALGGVTGGLAAPRIVSALGELRCLILAPTVISIAYLLGGLVTNGIELGATLAVGTFAITQWNVVTVSLRQRVVPSGLLGRVNSVYRMLGWGLIPMGAVLGGWIASAWGLRAALPVAGALRAVVLLVALPALIAGVRALEKRP